MAKVYNEGGKIELVSTKNLGISISACSCTERKRELVEPPFATNNLMLMMQII